MANQRMAQVNELIKQQLGEVILHELEMPPGKLVTITKVDTSRDLHYARVYLSVLPTAAEKELFSLLKKNIRQLQYQLHQKIKLRISPKLHFTIDEAQKKAVRINELLDSVK